MLDTTLLGASELLLFGTAFVAVYGGVAAVLAWRPDVLRPVVHHTDIRYAGLLLAAIVGGGASLVLPSPFLRVGLLGATFFVCLVGIRDEQQSLSAGKQLLAQLLIATLAVLWGWQITAVSNVSGVGIASLATETIGPLVLPGAFVTVIYLVVLINALNWLDGVDGLASAVSTIALIALAIISMLPHIHDLTALRLSLVGAGGLLGFLLWNITPARVYLGTVGSWFVGLFIGLVAILGDGKVATTLLVLIWPVADMVFVLWQRWQAGQPLSLGDRKHHLHHHLLRAGFSPRAIVLLASAVTALAAIVALALQAYLHVVALIVAASMLGAGIIYYTQHHRAT